MNSAAVRFNGQEPSPEATSNPQTYLVTGGTGFLGCALVARLPADGRTTRIARSLPRSSGGFVACDLNAMVQAWRAAAEGCSGVFHLAWPTVPKTANADPLADLETNVTGTVRLLEALRGLPNIPITFASSAAQYTETPTPCRFPRIIRCGRGQLTVCPRWQWSSMRCFIGGFGEQTRASCD
jgi:NAD-dependent epimerase/dehydratase family protein